MLLNAFIVMQHLEAIFHLKGQHQYSGPGDLVQAASGDHDVHVPYVYQRLSSIHILSGLSLSATLTL